MKRTLCPSRSLKGQSLIEFALVLPLLALVLFAIIQYGFVLAAHIALRNATVVGARYATLQINPAPSVAQIENITKAAVASMLDTNSLTVTVNTNATVGGVAGARVVQAQYNLRLVIPFVVPGGGPGGSVTLSATTVMR